MTKTIPAQNIIVCDSCGKEGYETKYGCRLIIERVALDYQHSPAADGTVKRDLCGECTTKIVAAINKASGKDTLA